MSLFSIILYRIRKGLIFKEISFKFDKLSMKMIQKVRLLFITSFVLTNLLLIIIGHFIFQMKFDEAEIYNLKHELKNISETINNEIIAIQNSSSAWTSWDDFYNFADKKTIDQNFLETNFSIDAISMQKYDKIIFIGNNPSMNFAFDYDHITGKKSTIKEQEVGEIKKAIFKHANLNLSKNFKGLFYYNKVYLVSVNPILKSDFSGPSKGQAIFFKEIDIEMLRKIQAISGHEIQFQVSHNTIAVVDNSFYEHLNDDISEGIISKTDLSNNHTVVFKVHFKRELSNIGREGIYLFMFIASTIMALLFFGIYRLTIKNIISPIVKIKNELREIRESSAINKRIGIHSKDELGELSFDINLSLEKIEIDQQRLAESSKMHGLGTLASGIAHEINNPLTVIKSNAEKNIRLLNDQVIDKDEIQKSSQKIIANAIRINKIISSLKNLSQNNQTEELSEISIFELVEELNLLFNEKLIQSKTILDLSECDLEMKLFVQNRQFLQLLIHLFNNAIEAEHSDENEKRWIKIKTLKSSNFIEILISNSGKKISQEIKNKAMEPFFTTKDVGLGTGLGLAMSFAIVARHSGTLEIIDNLENTTIKITLPLIEANKEKIA